MKLNGRFSPFEEERNENDPDADFPIQEKTVDFQGKERAFEITNHAFGLGFIVQAVEQGKEEGYVFSAFDPNSPYLALGKLRDKMKRALSTCHLVKEDGQYWPFHDTLRGRITSEEGNPILVVDGIPLSLEELGKMIVMHEGWEFTLRFIDRTEV
ncbi:MAG: hypothetical protein Q7S27_02640 [Nanoarchaeota archaeon]|nr:hypothetical protein [Nanoarchaeota archaeon]